MLQQRGHASPYGVGRVYAKAKGRLGAALGAVLTVAVMCGAMARADTPTKIVALGDSLVAGYGLAQGDGFVPQLDRWLKAQGVSAEVANAGVSGDTTAGGLARLGWSLEGQDADALIVVLGGNDLLRGIDPAASRSNLDALLAEASARGLSVLMGGMQAPGNYGPEWKAAFDAMYPELAQTHDALLYPYFLAGVVEDRRLWQPDGIHPNAEGVAVIVEGIGPLVLELLERAQ